jgi:hypothetical protein
MLSTSSVTFTTFTTFTTFLGVRKNIATRAKNGAFFLRAQIFAKQVAKVAVVA